MKRKLKMYAKDINGKRVAAPDVRPLDQRESKLDIRKGMIKQRETVNITFLEHQETLFSS